MALGRSLASCLIMVWTISAHAIDSLVAYRAALENDPAYATARASFDASAEKLVQGRGGLLPSATMSANIFGISDQKLIIYAGGVVVVLITLGPAVYRKWGGA